jgi:hypothetical protein
MERASPDESFVGAFATLSLRRNKEQVRFDAALWQAREEITDRPHGASFLSQAGSDWVSDRDIYF